MTVPLCFIDTETDGVHPGRKVWEVAAVRREADGTENEIAFFVDIDLETSDPFGLQVGRFYQRHPWGRYLSGELPDFSFALVDDDTMLRQRDAAETVARFTHGAHLVGAVPNFDAEVLARLLRDNTLTPAWHHHLIDVEAMAVGWLNGLAAARVLDTPIPRDRPAHESAGEYLRDKSWRAVATANTTPPWKSDELSRACGVEPPAEDERHTALGDARWAMRWYDAITGRSPASDSTLHHATQEGTPA